MGAVEVQHHLRRAKDFYEGMTYLSDELSIRNSSALLAIHCAISYSDALRTGLGETSLSSEDHATAVNTLRNLLKQDQRDGLKHLQQLLTKKSAIAYGSRRIADEEYSDVLSRVERFVRWANRIGSELKVGGWTDGA